MYIQKVYSPVSPLFTTTEKMRHKRTLTIDPPGARLDHLSDPGHMLRPVAWLGAPGVLVSPSALFTCRGMSELCLFGGIPSCNKLIEKYRVSRLRIMLHVRFKMFRYL